MAKITAIYCAGNLQSVLTNKKKKDRKKKSKVVLDETLKKYLESPYATETEEKEK